MKKKKKKRKRLFEDGLEDVDALQSEVSGQDEDEEEMMEGVEQGEEEEKEEEDTSLPTFIGISKFQRLRHFHYFLWVLVHGYGPEGGEGKRGPLSLNHYPWAKVVSQLHPGSSGSRWISFKDIISNMPLALWTIIIKPYSGVSKTNHMI